MRAYLFYNWLFRNTFGRLKYYRQFSEDIEIIENSHFEIRKILRGELSEISKTGRTPSFLDAGARDGAQSSFAKGYAYFAMDLNPRAGSVVVGDICNCPEIEDNSFDIVFSLDLFEHLKRPWDAAKECIRITRPNGLLIHRTLFSYRYHPHPIDYWRFSSHCLEYLFTETGQVQTILKGYDIKNRRRDMRGNGLKSKPPIDYLGGFRENWRVLYVGRKMQGNAADNF